MAWREAAFVLLIAAALNLKPVACFTTTLFAPRLGDLGSSSSSPIASSAAVPVLLPRSAASAVSLGSVSRRLLLGGAGGRCGGALRCSASGKQMGLAKAEEILKAYDAGHQEAARLGTKGLGGGTSATEWADAFEDREGVRAAVEAMCGEASRVMIGICASDAGSGVGALKAWIEGLGLTKGMLHGMDKDGEPLDMDTFGAVYIKYNSMGGEISQPGDAMLNGYAGDFRGVYFSPTLPDGEFRQYAVLPLSLFPAPGGGSGPAAGGDEGLLDAVAPLLAKLGAKAEVASFDKITGSAVIRFEGDANLKFGVEDSLKGDPRVKSVAFVDF